MKKRADFRLILAGIFIILFLILSQYCFSAWDNDKPADSSVWNNAAGEIRANNDAIEGILGVERLEYTSLSAAVTAIGSTKTTLTLIGAETISANLVIPSTLTLRFEQGAILTIATGVTLTINGPMEAGLFQIFTYAGTGTVAFGVGAVEKVYLQWWGGAGDNSTNNSPAMTSAIAALPATGGTIKATVGKWNLSTTITLPDEPRILVIEGEQGQGALGNTQIEAGTTFYPQQTDGTHCFQTDNDDVRSCLVFRNFGIIGNDASGEGFRLIKCPNVIMENIHVEGMGSHGIHLMDCEYATLRKCLSHTNGKSGTGWGIVSGYSSAQTFDGCIVHNNTSGNLTINDDTLYLSVGGSTPASSTISNTNILGGDYSMDNSGVDQSGIRIERADQSVIQGIYIENTYTDSDADAYPIYITGHSPGAVIRDTTLIGVQIQLSQNTITGGQGYPVYIKWAEVINFIGCRFSVDDDQDVAVFDANTGFAYIDGGVTHLNTQNSNNLHINDVPTRKPFIPFIATAAGCTNFIGTKYVHTFTAADTTPQVYDGFICLTSNTGAISITDFDGPILAGAIITIFGNDSGYTTIVHNASYINLNGGANFTLQNGDTMTLLYDGTDWNEISRSYNQGYTATLTWNPGSLGDGAGETSSGITITGAALGDFVLVSAPYDLQDCTVTGYVQAANTIEIRLQNESAGTRDLAEGSWKVRLIK